MMKREIRKKMMKLKKSKKRPMGMKRMRNWKKNSKGLKMKNEKQRRSKQMPRRMK